jgi:hypothetical protein
MPCLFTNHRHDATLKEPLMLVFHATVTRSVYKSSFALKTYITGNRSGEGRTVCRCYIEQIIHLHVIRTALKPKLCGLSPRANYTYRATAACLQI